MSTIKKLLATEWRLLLFGFLMTFFSAPGQTFFISLFSGEIREELLLSHGQFGAIYSIATLSSAIVMVWSGALVDKIELKVFSIAIVLGLALGGGLLSVSSSLVALVIAIFLLRQFGQGLMYLTSSTAMVRYLESNKGKATALAAMGYSVGEACLPVIVVLSIAYLGWRMSWLATAVVLLVVILPAIIFLLRDYRQRYGVTDKQQAVDSKGNLGGKNWSRKEVVRDKYFYLFLPAMLSQQLMFTGFIFHQTHLVEYKQWSLSVWASLFTVYAIVAVSTKLVSGIVIDKIGALPVVPVMALPMGLGLLALSLSNHIVIAFVFLVLMGITVGLQGAASAPFWVELYGTRHIGAIKSLATALMVFFTALSPVIFGILLDYDITIDVIAFYSFIYVLLVSALAYYAYRLIRLERFDIFSSND